MEIFYQTDSDLIKKAISNFNDDLLKSTISKSINDEKSKDNIIDKEVKVNGEKVWLGLKK